MTSKAVPGIEVPIGWRISPYSGRKDVFVFHSPQRYMVTVDYDRRCFRSGSSIYGRPENKVGYRGRGWRQALTDEAIKWLVTDVGETPVES